MLWNTAGSLFYLLCNWLTTVLVVTLASGYEASGSLAVAMAVGNVFASIMLYKVRTIQVADIHNVCDASDYVGHRIVTMLIAAAFCVVYCMFTVSVGDLAVVFAYLLFKAIESFIDVLHGVDQKEDRFEYIGISQFVRGLLVVVAFVAGFLLFHDLVVAVLLMALSSIVVLLAFDIPKTSGLSAIRPSLARGKIAIIFKRATPGFFSLLICTMVISLVRQMFGMEYGNELLGVYAAIAAPTVIVQAAASYLYAPLLGPLAYSWSRGDVAAMIRTVARFALMLVAIIGICVILFSLFGEPVFSFVFQKDMSGNMYLVTPLLICTGLTAAVYFALDLLMITAENVGAVVSSAASLLVALCAMHALFGIAGANGISLTIIFAQLANLIVAALFLVRCFARKRRNSAARTDL